MNNTQKLDDIRRRIRRIETRLDVDRFGRGVDVALGAAPVIGERPLCPGPLARICEKMQAFVPPFRVLPEFAGIWPRTLISLARWCSPRTIAAIVLVCQSLRFSRWPLQ
jgi:hypothetical protein